MKERLFSSLLRKFRPDSPLGEHLSQGEQDFRFAMQYNGCFLHKKGKWPLSSDAVKPFLEEFKGQQVSFFGPEGDYIFFSIYNTGDKQSIQTLQKRFIQAFEQKSVTDVIRKYRNIDENQAARIAFLFGGIIRHKAFRPSNSNEAGEIASAVDFVARMTMLGAEQSGDAIASAISMYIISGGSLAKDDNFTRHVNQMSEAIREDPIKPLSTEDLGLSQVARLRTFLDKMQARESSSLPDIQEHKEALGEFPTVGAEFHFSKDAPNELPYFWQRLAILNMSQYQRGSYVQLSRNDRDIIEVRMNPSIYPITIANWNYIRLLLPELNQAFFTITFNRKDEENFHWNNKEDKTLLDKLQTLGMLSYAGMFENVPASTKTEEINFGSIYLGQTVKVLNGKYGSSGNWRGGEGVSGQLGIYAGFGNNLPYLAYYPSMVMANPDIFESIPQDLLAVKTLDDALAVKPNDRKKAFIALQDRVAVDERLNKAVKAGNKIMELLNP